MLTALILTHIIATAAPSGFADSTVTLYYVIGIIAALIGAVVGGYKIYQRQKIKWTDEGITRAKQAQVMTENNNQLKENTNAIVSLTTHFQEWTTKVTQDINGLSNGMNGLSHRIDKLERYTPRQRSKIEDQE